MFFKKLFGKNEETNNNQGVIVSPATGKLIALEEVPDPVFSTKMMGDGLAVDPSEGLVVSPIDGEVLQVFPTKHAVGLKTADNIEVLIHIGLETVAMNGEGFEAFVKEGDKVKKGDKLISFDLDLYTGTITPIIITNSADMESIVKANETSLTKGETTVLTVTPKK